ncbi:MAG: ABC transporter substrate-binding protein [Phreatobacter sp.]|uniref:ABC transporter substrate-binding protein n=1 Tax=Phreatobacter sp. TaxID=1966341 RepID=UPI002733F1F2|nr:ABC transporter substrate-binding protein [Phreatobacter sp.]MDP2801925.1 ABC transporter substrate-binding protein [Phreatobacter sp.]
MARKTLTSSAFSRRTILKGAALAAGAATLPGAAGAQATSAPLRIGISLSDVPRMWGGPEGGFEGLRFGAYMVFDALVNWDMTKADQPSGLTPGLATKWEIDPANRQRWIITLREGVTFHDGTAFDADAVIWNFDSIFKADAPQFHQPRVGLVRSRLSSIAGYTKIDARTIAVTTNVVDGMLPYQLAYLWFVSPARLAELGGDWQRFTQRPAGTGPYKVVSVTPRERVELEANAAYWDKSRVPKTQRTVLLPIPDANARIASLRSGTIDIAETLPPDAIPSLKSAGFQVVQNSYPHIWAWRLNVNPGTPFADVRVRRAANLAIDRDSMVQLLSGTALPAKGKVLPGDPWFGKPSFDIRHDVAAAKRLMTEAGYGPAKRLEVVAVIASGGGGQMVPLPMNEMIQENLKEIWIDVKFEVVDFTTIINMLRGGTRTDQQKGFHALNIAIPSIDPTTGWVIYDSTLTAPRGVNWGWYNNPAIDAQIKVMREAFDPAAQNEAMGKLHALLVDDAAALFVVHDLNPRGLSARVKGFVQARNWFQDYTPVTVGPAA